MALHRYGDFRVEVFYFDSPCICIINIIHMNIKITNNTNLQFKVSIKHEVETYSSSMNVVTICQTSMLMLLAY